MRPEAALALTAGAVVAALAWRSLGYPLALAALPPILFGIYAGNPLPESVAAVGLSAAVVLGIVAAAHRHEEVPPPRVLFGAPVVLTALLLFLLVARQPAGAETNYGEIKTAFFGVSNVVLLVGGIYAGWSPARLRLVLLGTLVVSIAGAVVLMLDVVGFALPVPLTLADEDHSISMGRQMAVGVLVALAVVLGRDDAPGRLLAAASLPVLVTALLASGARGPIVALLAGATVLLVLGLWDRVARRRLVVVAALAAVAVVLVPLVVPDSTLVRSFSFASTDVEGTSSGRTDMWRESWQVISERPETGVGTGGYSEINPPMIYPHNLLLELGVELGIAGVLLMILFLAHAVWRLLRAFRRGPHGDRVTVAAVLALLTAAVTNAMFSFALHSNWETWLWAGAGTALAARVLRDRGGAPG